MSERSGRIGRIKGSAFREFLRWYGEQHGQAAVEAALAALPPEARLLVDVGKEGYGILPSAWYPAPVVHALLGVLFAALATPERYVRFGQRLWDAYYDSGTVIMDLHVPGRLRSRIIDWPAHHRFICDMNQHAGVFIVEAMGLKVVGSSRAECVSTGGRECRIETSWVVN